MALVSRFFVSFSFNYNLFLQFKGKTWHTADLTEDLKAKQGRHWSWSLWKVELPVDKNINETEIWAKAVDSAYNVQPESFANIYNIRGLLCNAYHIIKVKLKQ